MRGPAPPVAARLKGAPWFVGFLALGLISLWLGLSGVGPTARAIAAGAPIVSFKPRDTIPLPLAVPFLALAVNALIVGATLDAEGRPVPARKAKGAQIGSPSWWASDFWVQG